MPPKPRAKIAKVESSLLTALNFVQPILRSDGAIYETHIRLENNWAVGFNGVLAAGHKIEEALEACPHNEMMIAALSKCGERFSITQLDNGKLSIKSEKFKAVVPCVEGELIQEIYPDPPIAPVDDRFKKALDIVGSLASETAQSVVTASILMNGFSLISTDRKMILEAYHGNDMPSLVLPKAFAKLISSRKESLKSFGFSNSSLTLWFENESFIKTQLYSESWPDVSSILDRPANMWNVPEGFFEAVKAIEPFSKEGNIYFGEGVIRSGPFEEDGASYEMEGTPNNVVYPVKHLNILKDLATKIDFAAPDVHNNGYCLMFVGDGVRGVVAGRER